MNILGSKKKGPSNDGPFFSSLPRLQALAFFISSINTGTASKRSPTIP